MIRDSYIKFGGSGSSLSTAKLIKTGQTISYRAGDDIARGRLVDIYTLSENNPFGNTDRFTDVLGTQVYADPIIVDWSTLSNDNTVLCYSKNLQSAQTWDNAIDAALITTIGGFSGWKLWNAREMMNVVDFEKTMADAFCLPFPTPSSALWTSTSATIAPSLYAFSYAYSNFTHIFANDKTFSLSYHVVRYFTLTELGL